MKKVVPYFALFTGLGLIILHSVIYYTTSIKENETAQLYRIVPEITASLFCITGSLYLFTRKKQTSGIESLRSLPYNYETCQWSEKHFDRTYQAKWIPKTIPTLLLAGEEDQITPLKLFRNDKRFIRENITFKSIKAAGHFPWIENAAEVAEAFNVYVNQLRE